MPNSEVFAVVHWCRWCARRSIIVAGIWSSVNTAPHFGNSRPRSNHQTPALVLSAITLHSHCDPLGLQAHIPTARMSRSVRLMSCLRRSSAPRLFASDRRVPKSAGAQNLTAMPNSQALTPIAVQRRIYLLWKNLYKKTHLAIALGVEACRKGHSVRFFRVPDLVSILQDKHESGTLARFQKELSDCDLLIFDEVGFVPFHQTGAELLFHVISACYEHNSVMVTSNLEFGQWNTVFGDTRLTAALVDRLVHHAHILAFTGESFRLRHALSTISS